MFGEQQSVIPNITSYSTPNPNPNPLPPHPDAIPYPYSHGFDGLKSRPASELDSVAASQSEMIPVTTDSTAYEHAGGTLTATTNVATAMHSAGNFGVMTQNVVNDVMVTRQPQIFQPMQCELCNVTCNTEDVFEKHKQGKKHFKNLQKQAISSVIAKQMPPPTVASAPLVGELANKKHNLLQNGASVDALLYCDVCNVVCNSQDVFVAHLAGKKHYAKTIIQNANTNGLKNPTSDCSQVAPQPPNGGSQKKPDTHQSARCELCNIICTSHELLNMHLSGKKHLKKLQESSLTTPNDSLETPPAKPMENAESTEGKAVISHDGKKIVDGSLTAPIASLETPPTKPMENPESTEGIVNSHEGKSAWCEICRINCNTYDVLKIHMSGKKHLKNLENSEKLIGPNPAPATATAPAATPMVIGPMVNADGSKKKSKRAVSHEDVETKRQKILQGGAASDALRTCTVCNVVCNSPTVFISHLAGQKHAAMAAKQAETGSAGQQT